MNRNVIDSAIMMSSIYLNTSNKIISEDEESIKKEVIEYIRSICYYERKNGKNTGLLEKMKYNDQIVDRYNKSFRSKENGRKLFSKVEITDYENPLKLDNLSEEFSEEKLNSLSFSELLAMAMHWSNRLAKAFDEKINDSKKESVKYGMFENEVYTTLLKEDLKDFYEVYLDYDGMTDEEIKEDLGEEEYKRYIEDRKKVERAIKGANIKLNSDVVSDYIQYSAVLSARSQAYAMKSKFMQRCMLEVLKTTSDNEEKNDVYQYITEDKDKANNDSYKNIYGVAFKGYTEPFEVHANSGDIEGCIAIANEILGKQCKVEYVYDVQRFKTLVPRKTPESIKKNMDKVGTLDSEEGRLARQVNNLVGQIKENSSRTSEVYTALGIMDAKELGGDR